MSKGVGGWCYIAEQDENTVIYKYGAYNLNDPQYENKEHSADGIIIIDKNSLVEPDIHEKIKRFPNGKKKLMTKRIVVEVRIKNYMKKVKFKCIIAAIVGISFWKEKLSLSHGV